MRTDDCDEAAPGGPADATAGPASAAEAAAARSMNRGGRTIGRSPSRVGYEGREPLWRLDRGRGVGSAGNHPRPLAREETRFRARWRAARFCTEGTGCMRLYATGQHRPAPSGTAAQSTSDCCCSRFSMIRRYTGKQDGVTECSVWIVEPPERVRRSGCSPRDLAPLVRQPCRCTARRAPMSAIASSPTLPLRQRFGGAHGGARFSMAAGLSTPDGTDGVRGSRPRVIPLRARTNLGRRRLQT